MLSEPARLEPLHHRGPRPVARTQVPTGSSATIGGEGRIASLRDGDVARGRTQLPGPRGASNGQGRAVSEGVRQIGALFAAVPQQPW